MLMVRKFAYGVVVFAAMSAASAFAADADATGLVPTLCMTFNGQSLANTGTGTLTMKDKGTPTYVPSVDGYALNASVYTPWGDNVSNVITANRDSSIAVVAALGTTSCGILVCFRNSSNNAGIILRRGTTANQIVLTQGNSTTALITVNDIDNADTDYHLYVMNILSGRVDLYVDGVLAGTTTSTPRANSMNSMQIGSRHGNVISPEAIYGGGLIDDLRVYASALSTEQMMALGDSMGLYSAFRIQPIPTIEYNPLSMPYPEVIVRIRARFFPSAATTKWPIPTPTTSAPPLSTLLVVAATRAKRPGPSTRSSPTTSCRPATASSSTSAPLAPSTSRPACCPPQKPRWS